MAASSHARDAVSDADSDESLDYEDHRLHLDTNLRDINKSALKFLNYTVNYVRDWTIDEGFRETYQNWRDGILRSFNLSPSDFRTTTEEAKNSILIKATKLDREELLGFIHFRYDNNGICVGGLKLANFRATLPYRSLGTGATSKATDTQQTGQHGEGMKLSALVFRRNGYNFRIESGDFKWNFIFKNGELACNLRRITAQTLDNLKKKEEGKARSAVSHPWEDVCVIIGAPGTSRDIHRNKIKAKILHVDDFRRMLKVTLDVDRPNKIISTPHGDLILDPLYKGKMYLRGLLLPSGGIRGKNYNYGYNFVDGTTTRDRDTLAGNGEESERIAAIWGSAIEADTSDHSDLLTEYTNLLLRFLNKKGDAMLSIDENCLTEATAKKVWRKMRTMNHSRQGRPSFYYLNVEGTDQVQIIEQSLINNPVPLDIDLWKMLSKYNLCRTPSAEVNHRFQFAEAVDVSSHSFGIHVSRMLKCLLQSSPHTESMELSFVNGERLGIDAGFFAPTWKIHSKWLTYDGAHKHVYCDESASEDGGSFVCDHVVLQLWDIMLAQLMASGEHASIAEEEGWLKSMARARVSQMPRAVKCAQTDHAGELRVTWESVDSHRNKDRPVRVVLHSNSCAAGTESYVQSQLDHDCRCLSQIATTVSDGITFKNLDLTRSYSASVSQDVEGAFFAVKPKSIKPQSENYSQISRPQLRLSQRSVAASVTTSILSSESEDEDDSIGPSMLLDDSESERLAGYSPSSRSRTRSAFPTTPDRPTRIQDDAVMNFGSHSQQPPVASVVSAAVPLVFTRDEIVQTDLTARPRLEVYLLGDKIEHRTLDWGGAFPGSHTFYRARNVTEEEIFILKPKEEAVSDNTKRKAREDLQSPVAKRRHLEAHARNESEELPERLRSAPSSLRSQTSHSMTVERNGISARRTAPSMTLSLEEGEMFGW